MVPITRWAGLPGGVARGSACRRLTPWRAEARPPRSVVASGDVVRWVPRQVPPAAPDGSRLWSGPARRGKPARDRDGVPRCNGIHRLAVRTDMIP